MRLLMLIPIFILMGVSGYNLAGGYTAPGIEETTSTGAYALHMAIIVLGMVAASLLVRSAFTVKYTEEEQPVKQEPFLVRLAHQLQLF
jgi:hypothetical protein